jgi:HK97 family phage portal protein
VSFLRRAFEQRDLVASGNPHSPMAAMGGPINVPTNGMGWGPNGWGGSASGVSVTDYSALGLTAFYACVRLLADSIASLPWDAYRKGDGEQVRREVSPAPSLLKAPAPDLTAFDWKHMMMVSLVMRGNFYGHVIGRDALEYPTDIVPLHPDAVRIERDPQTLERRAFIGTGPVPLRDLFHIRAFSLPGSDVGLSPVQMARHSLGLGLAAQEYGAKWFRDGASPSSVIETDAELDDDQVQRVQRSWISSHGGRRRPAVLSGGFKWKPITITPEESQFLQTREHQGIEVAQMMGVPPHMIGIVDRSTSWGTGIEQQSIGYVTYTLRPWLTRIEAAMTDVLPRGQFLKFNVDALLRGDQKSRYEAYRTAIESGWSNPDEVRALEDLPPIPGGAGSKYRQPLNFGPLGTDHVSAADLTTSTAPTAPPPPTEAPNGSA